MKKRKTAAIIIAVVLMSCGCGAAKETTEMQDEVSEETIQEEEPEVEVEEESETEEELEEAPPVYVEDKNVYGNTIGNLYNDGTFIYSEEDACFYFLNIYSGYLVRTIPETGDTVNLTDKWLTMLNLYDGKLYGLENTEEQESGKLYVYDLQESALEVLREDPVSYLQVADGILYFTDDGDHTLRKMEAESREETILVEETVYYPVVYKDIIVFQLDSDKESLYSIPKDGGEPVKLNNLHSYDPMVYRDRIYYKALDENEEYTVRSMNLDGSEEEILLPTGAASVNLYNGVLYYVQQDTPNKVCYIDLADETREVHTLELGDLIRSALKNAYGTTEIQIVSYGPIQFSGDYMIFMDVMKIGEQAYADEYIYKMDTEELFIIPEYCVETKNTAAMQKTANTSSHNYYQNCTQEQADQADAIASQIADSIMSDPAYTTDLQRVTAAAQTVASYCNNSVYGTDENKYYRSPYGVFVAGVYTCAGSTRALGRVLDYMGYSWQHTNENKWVHQWCILTMDGQTGYADGMGGIAGYGEMVSGMTLEDGRTIYFPTE